MSKIMIANRGEIASRIIRSCRALRLGCVAVYSDVDEASKHVAEADEAFYIGQGPASQSYLNGAAIIDAARRASACAIHPGYGFLAEDARFAAAVEEAGLIWVGPTPRSILDMGDKQRARLLAQAAGVPVLPGSVRLDSDDERELLEAATLVGFPLLVKSAAGGGGIGMRRVDDSGELVASVKATRSLANKAFGNGSIYLERFIARARHIEVQVFGFGNGDAVHFFERDCSTQRRYQKIIEESPAHGLPADVLEQLQRAAVSLCKQERYRGAGTVEFIVDTDTHAFFFLEMNTRIQVEHPVTEMTSGVDLVALQLQLALGLPLQVTRQEQVKRSGHAIESRIYAERPAKNFLPSTGRLALLSFPSGDPSVRVDTGVRQGDTITPFYDPMIAKLVVHAEDRHLAIEKMMAALQATVIQGVETNIDFLQRVLSHPAFLAGALFTGFVDQEKAALLS